MTESIATPPSAPRDPADEELSRGLRFSIAAHLGVIAIVVIKSLVFPSSDTAILPTLRVDIVGLPDQLKGQVVPAPQTSNDIAKLLKKAEQEAKEVKKLKPINIPKPKEPVEKAKPDEMVLKPKQAQRDAEKKREKRMESALARIKALEDISADETPSKAKGQLIKGNKISKGTSLSAEARESMVASYYDSLRDSLNNNFALPVWLSRQELSAQVQIFIDNRGGLRGFRFTKSSGNAQFDSLVKKAVESSQPFTPPPADIANSLLADGISVGFPL